MGIGQFLFSFNGRINRAKIWLFLLARFIYDCVAFILFFSMIGLDTIMAIGRKEASPETLQHAIAASMAAIGLIGLTSLVIYFCILAVGAKRLHDRGKSAWWLLVFYGLPFLLQFMRIFTAIATMQTGGQTQSDPLGSLLGLVALGIMIWGFVELYCLRGTVGDNKYGADPIPAPA